MHITLTLTLTNRITISESNKKSVNKIIFCVKMFTEEKYMNGKKIKYHRLRKGLTTEQLASIVGCTKAAISLYESDERKPNNEVCMKIAKALDVPWIELLSNSNESLAFNHISFRKKQKASKGYKIAKSIILIPII